MNAMVTIPRFISIREASDRGQKAGATGFSRRNMHRRLVRLHRLSGNRLLVDAREDKSTRCGKWLVDVAVLDEMLAYERLQRDGSNDLRQELDRLRDDVDRSHDRCDALDLRTQAQRGVINRHSKKLRHHGERIDLHENALVKLASALQLVAEVNALLKK